MTSDILKQNFEFKKENARLRQENNELKKENNKLKNEVKRVSNIVSCANNKIKLLEKQAEEYKRNGEIFIMKENNKGKEILKLLQENYDINTTQDLSSALKDMFKGALQ